MIDDKRVKKMSSEYTWPKGNLTVEAKVGIGTPDPHESLSLEVIGTIKGEKFIGDGSSLNGLVKTIGNSTITGSLTISNDLNVKDNFQLGTLWINKFSNDGNLAENSHLAIPTEQAVKTYVDGQIKQVNNNLSTKAALTYVDQKIQGIHSSLSTGKLQIGNIDITNKYISTKKVQGDKSRLHLTSNERIYLLAKEGVHIAKEAGGNGNLRVDGKLQIGNIDITNKYISIRGNGLLSASSLSTGKLEIGNIDITNKYISTKKVEGDKSRLHLTSNERIYLLAKEGIHIAKEGGGNGNMIVDSKL